MPQDRPPRIKALLESLTGQEAPLGPHLLSSFEEKPIGYSQFNELLLLFGYDRVAPEYFQYLVDGTLAYEGGRELASLEDLEKGIERARKLSLLFFGNVKFGFKRLARDPDSLSYFVKLTLPIDRSGFMKRHDPIQELDRISSDQTHCLGYLIQEKIRKAVSENPNDEGARKAEQEMEEVRKKGLRNHDSYLVSDHLDVYVATSMRQQHEYVEVARLTDELFKHEKLKELKLRWFDPTQACCTDRIDKGLAEALMLKRAKCTLYLAQESDTLGKDSELASTLAQGKPVIAFVPAPSQQEIRDSVGQLALLYNKTEADVILERLQAISPKLAWTDEDVRRWLSNPKDINRDVALELLTRQTQQHYDKRAKILMDSHPLGIQVHLETGVANGVLVVRSVQQCAELILRIITSTLEFSIETKTSGGREYHLLIENVSKSIFRVMTGDAMLTNSFWNFYLEPSQQ